MGELPWSERVNMLSINPHAATIEDIAKLAADASENYDLRAEIERLREAVEWACTLKRNKNSELDAILDELRRRAGKEG